MVRSDTTLFESNIAIKHSELYGSGGGGGGGSSSGAGRRVKRIRILPTVSFTQTRTLNTFVSNFLLSVVIIVSFRLLGQSFAALSFREKNSGKAIRRKLR